MYLKFEMLALIFFSIVLDKQDFINVATAMKAFMNLRVWLLVMLRLKFP